MTQSFDPLPPDRSLPALSVGNVVSAGFRLYSNHLQQYLGLALRATGWTLLPLITSFGILTLLIGFGAAGASSGDNGPAVIAVLLGLILAIPLFFLWIFCFAKYYLNAALISRLAYGALTNQPETMREGLQAIRGKLWNFWLVQFLIWGILFGVSMVWSFAQQIIMIIPAAFVGSSRDTGTIGIAGIVMGLLLFILLLLQYGLQFWISARLFIPELSIALEERIGADKALNRSWSLSKGHSLRIMLILLVAWLITLPLYSLIGIPLFVFMIGQVSRMSSLSRPDLEGVGIFFMAIGVGSILLVLINIFIIPFWQAIKAVLYYDLRTRREGLGLELRDRP
jgi:hypothetical protein